jgi:aminoglycoside 6-adenylyltransferase
LWREEIIYAKAMVDQVLRKQLMKTLTWYLGMITQFSNGPGQFGKHLKRYLEPELWAMLEKTYADAGYENTWEALIAMCDLFRITAYQLTAEFRLDYPEFDEGRVIAHLRHVRTLPKDASEIY